ncbi:uncharacterized protein LOC119981227 [Tripterygium wilfordii]|uniref:uncharacterized protein LOC119981227 n=1 Tax=Tripterygium wilfordii TaxID=458696 RepID=UPI0018F8401F|nr:uncharacterized protein LOC119981227 [Tripterygium wilfordii]
MNPATSEFKNLALPPGVDEIQPLPTLYLERDPSDEMFEKLPLPDFGTAYHGYRLEVENFDGLLAIILYQWQSADKWFDTWVMTEYGVSYWVKRGSTGRYSVNMMSHVYGLLLLESVLPCSRIHQPLLKFRNSLVVAGVHFPKFSPLLMLLSVLIPVDMLCYCFLLQSFERHFSSSLSSSPSLCLSVMSFDTTTTLIFDIA